MNHGLLWLSCVLYLAFAAAPQMATAQHPVLVGVTALESTGIHSPILALDGAWTPLIGGGSSSWFPTRCDARTLAGPAPLAAAARTWGSGRIVFSSRDWSAALSSNAVFRRNVALWLANGRPGALGWTTGHQEWHGASSDPAVIPALATSLGRASFAIPGTITAQSLAGVAVLYVLDPWGYFTEAERSVIMQWVNGGGGLWVNALGWSWGEYNPGQNVELDHPAARLLAGTGAIPVRSYITWPTGQPQLFNMLGSQTHTGDAFAALMTLWDLHQIHGASLPTVLEQDAVKRSTFVGMHSVLAYADLLSLPSTYRDAAMGACGELLAGFPTMYGRGTPIASTFPTMLRGRERLWRTLTDLTPDSSAERTSVASMANWTGSRYSLFVDYGLVVTDNDRASTAQLNAIHKWVSSIPAGRLSLEAITISDFLPVGQAEFDISGPGCQVNVFSTNVGVVQENPFPTDAPAWRCDLFFSVVAHEVSHALDAGWVTPSPTLDARRDALIADAGTQSLNYLRSMLPTGFFAQNPQEFIASIANQWTAESHLCFRLGRTRFESGRRQPIEQALFFAELYATGNTSLFFRGSPSNPVVPRQVALTRDALGRIRTLKDGTTNFQFGYGADGHVVGVTETSDDCNANGIPDSYEILVARTVSDSNADMIPDLCQCPADINLDGVVNSVDVATLLGAWGAPQGGLLDTDLNDDGIVNAADLAILLAAWGPCPN